MLRRVLYIAIAVLFTFSTFTPIIADPNAASAKTHEFKFLSAQEIKKLFPGSSIKMTSSRGSDLQTWYAKDGTFEGLANNSFSYGGEWWTEEPDKYCFSGNRPARCLKVSYNGGKELKFHGRRGTTTATIDR